jgi:F-type H+-transporting ATPase subunit b
MEILPNITIFYQFANFIILLIFLNFFLFKPIIGALKKREGAIQSLAERVEKAKQDAKDLERQYDEVTQEKKRPIFESKDVALSEANTGATGIIEKARQELTEELSKIKDEIEREGKKVYDTLRADVGKLSAEVAAKILRRSLQ